MMAQLRVLILLALTTLVTSNPEIRLSRERMVFQTDHGDIHMAFYPDVAPVTVAHILRLGDLGAFNTVDFFRVDVGFVAQVSDIRSGRQIPLDPVQAAEAEINVPFEVQSDVKHDKRGILSMARGDDPNSGGSSFSILLGAAPHLDMNYAIFGEVTRGLSTLASMEQVETRREGIFVMPVKRITILSTYMYVIEEAGGADTAQLQCLETFANLQKRYDAQAVQLERVRQQRLPA